MVKLLFLDDEEWRHKELNDYINKYNIKIDIIHVYNYDNCIKALSKKYDIISLDHDLNQEPPYSHFNSHQEWYDAQKNGLKIAKYMYDIESTYDLNDKNTNSSIFIHSWNMPGASNMASYLNKRHYVTSIPFGSEYFSRLHFEVDRLSKGS